VAPRRKAVDMEGMKSFALFALLASAAFANPAADSVTGIISQDNTGYIVRAEVIQQYTRLCKLFPQVGDKPGDGVFVVDEGVFHLDAAHFNDYVAMLEREQSASLVDAKASEKAKSSN
jgi:hypothetical protein